MGTFAIFFEATRLLWPKCMVWATLRVEWCRAFLHLECTENFFNRQNYNSGPKTDWLLLLVGFWKEYFCVDLENTTKSTQWLDHFSWNNRLSAQKYFLQKPKPITNTFQSRTYSHNFWTRIQNCNFENRFIVWWRKVHNITTL